MPLRKFFQRLAPTLSVYFLLVSLGFPLQRVYCACVGEQWVSLPTEVHECRHAQTVDANHHHEHGKTPCCRHMDTGSDYPVAKDLHGCGDTDILLAQLDADFVWEQERLVVIAAITSTAIITSSVNNLVRQVIPKSTPIRGPTPPPLPAGRDLLVAQQTFLI
ncbi:MAG: hypothetical protein AAGF89_08070 [Bacteroidota bacterium]